MRMLRVPGGAFSMGSRDGEDDERPVHTETVDPFDIDETEVTVAQYAACVRGHACAEPIALTGCNENVPGRADHPMNCVTWTEADTFCRAAGKRLPSEREWEYAAKGMSPRRWPWGPVPPRAQMCWDGDGNSVGKGNRQSTCPVGAYAEDKGPFGVLDLGGNVAEWTASRYCPYTDPNCTSDARVIRGCGWDTQAVAACTTTYRDKRSEFEKETSLGFRCARTP